MPAAGRSRRVVQWRLLSGSSFDEAHGFLIDGQDDAASLADDAVIRPRRMNAKRTRRDDAVLITLAAGEHEDVLPAVMQMHGDSGFFSKSDQSCRRPGDAITVEAVDVHAGAKKGPGDVILALEDVEDVLQLEVRKTEARRR